MKSPASLVEGALGLGAATLFGIATWGQALAQGAPGGEVPGPSVAAVPEPSSLALMATGVALVAAFKKFRKRN
jgi:hypothetical protein